MPLDEPAFLDWCQKCHADAYFCRDGKAWRVKCSKCEAMTEKDTARQASLDWNAWKLAKVAA